MRRITRWQDIKPGAMWSVHGSALISRLIRFFSRSYWNHSGWVVCLDEKGEPWTQEALSTVQVNPLANYRKEFDAGNLAVYQPRLPAPILLYMQQKAQGRVGMKYPWISTGSLLLWLAVNRVANLFGRQVTTPHRQREKCSEEVLVAALDGIELRDFTHLDCVDLEWALRIEDRELFTPGDLVVACEWACDEYPG